MQKRPEGLGRAAVIKKGRVGWCGPCPEIKAFFMQTDPDEGLKRQLRLWEVQAKVPPSFQREVWRKIAARPGAADRRFAASWRIEWLIGGLGRPRCALPLGLTILVVSLGVARIQADSANGKTWRTLETRYVTSVDPVAMAEVKR